MLFASVVVAPMIFVENVIGNELSKANGASLSLLFMLTAFAAYNLGGVLATLDHLDGDDSSDDSADPRLHRVTPPPAI